MDAGDGLLAISALTVALLTAWFAERRLNKTLASNDRQQTAALEAERLRLREQLDHERKLKDIEELRVVLDEAAGIAANALHLAANIYDRVASRDIGEMLDYDLRGELNDARRAADSIGRQHERLRLRLGKEYPLTLMYFAVYKQLATGVIIIEEQQVFPLSGANRDRVSTVLGEAEQAFETFVEMSVPYVGTPNAVDPYVTADGVYEPGVRRQPAS